MHCTKHRKFTALWAIAQGLLTAVVPQLSVVVTKRLIGKHFENADELVAKPGYLRQIRALGLGLAAAGLAQLTLQAATDDNTAEESSESES